jgi:hypothetical protein
LERHRQSPELAHIQVGRARVAIESYLASDDLGCLARAACDLLAAIAKALEGRFIGNFNIVLLFDGPNEYSNGVKNGFTEKVCAHDWSQPGSARSG